MEYLSVFLNEVVFVILEGATLLYMYLYILDKLDFIRKETGKVILFLAMFFFFGHFIVSFDSF